MLPKRRLPQTAVDYQEYLLAEEVIAAIFEEFLGRVSTRRPITPCALSALKPARFGAALRLPGPVAEPARPALRH